MRRLLLILLFMCANLFADHPKANEKEYRLGVGVGGRFYGHFQIRYPNIDSLLFSSVIIQGRFLPDWGSDDKYGDIEFIDGQSIYVERNEKVDEEYLLLLAYRSDIKIRKILLGVELRTEFGYGHNVREFNHYNIDSLGNPLLEDAIYSNTVNDKYPVFHPPFGHENTGAYFYCAFDYRRFRFEVLGTGGYQTVLLELNLSYQLTTKPLRKKRTRYRLQKI